MRRVAATFGLPRVEEGDRHSVTRTGISDHEMGELRSDNPVLHAVITQGLEEIAPQNVREKRAIRDFLGKVLGTIQAADLRETLSTQYPDLDAESSVASELPPAA